MSTRGWRQVVGTLIGVVALLPALAATGAPAPPGRGAVACAAPDAAAAGAAVLTAGGNAVDAAVATALALAVVHPQAGNLGGGGFALVRIGGAVAALDFREVAPAAAKPDMYLGPDGKPVAQRSLVGPLAAGVPGSPAGLHELHRRFGALPWASVVEPALRLAADGFPVTPRLAKALAAERGLLARFPATAATWLPGGKAPAAGSRIVLRRLADTLAGYAREGPAAITAGRRAAAIEREVRAAGGILTAADLAAYRPVWREPLRFSASGFEVASMPLPSSGGIIIAESCGMLERLRWAQLPAGGVERAHLLAEVWRRAFADRFLLGDPTTSLAEPGELLAPRWLELRAASIDRRRAGRSAAVQPWSPPQEHPETTLLSVIDAAGDAVALTTTLNA